MILRTVSYLRQVSTHSRPKAADSAIFDDLFHEQFQHTAARRRLALNGLIYSFRACFNTQPPEGG